MTSLRLTVIDVGWGDSLLLESLNGDGYPIFALIDSNDSTYLQSSYIFLKRFFEKRGIDTNERHPLFEFVLLTHDHTDHAQGLHRAFQAFGTKAFWYPKVHQAGALSNLIRYADRSDNVLHHQAIDRSKALPAFGEASIRVLWPRYNEIARNENNNSVVLLVTVGQVSFLLAGDAEAKVWEQIAGEIPPENRLVKVPHHGSANGTFTPRNLTPWLDSCTAPTYLVISSHVRPHTHPDPSVITEFERRNCHIYRTDEHYHVTVSTDGIGVTVRYSH
ncbi:MAG: ComEC/Rec2 family competence protein [Armatimonadota bacterium]